MSNFKKKTKHPITGKIEEATWIDDYFGPRKYGVMFNDGMVYRESLLKISNEVEKVRNEMEKNKKNK